MYPVAKFYIKRSFNLISTVTPSCTISEKFPNHSLRSSTLHVRTVNIYPSEDTTMINNNAHCFGKDKFNTENHLDSYNQVNTVPVVTTVIIQCPIAPLRPHGGAEDILAL